MSRIRSVHPGFFKDERLVPCSAFARLLFIGLGVEADDKGIFEWKPVTLKMNIFPGDNVDVATLLAELVDADAVMQFEHNDRTYGAIRNFRKFQKPKTPNDIHPMPDYVADYVAFPQKGETQHADTDQLPLDGEKLRQMEDGGGKREDEDTSPPPVHVAEEGARGLFDELWTVFPRNPSSPEPAAEAAFLATKATDQPLILAAARRYAAWFLEDCAARDRTVDAGARYVPHLAKWITEGKWRDSAKLPVKSDPSKPVKPMTRLSRVRDEALWTACERIMNKPAATSTDGWSFPADIVAQARKELAH